MEDKYVDESWKESIASEKEKILDSSKEPQKEEQPQEQSPAESAAQAADEDMEFNFLAYVSSLAFQAMIFLGEIPNPVTNQVDKNLRQAKFLIDTLLILKDKTKGNLDQQESDMLNGALYELQMRYVELSGQPGAET